MSIYSEDELNPPKWLNETFIRNGLAAYERVPELVLESLTLSPATVKGDHGGSTMYRAKIAYKMNKSSETIVARSLIVKTLPENEGFKREFLQSSELFETEISMYTDVVPKIEAILKENGDSTEMSPKVLFHALQPNKVIVMEDLCTRGYDVVRGRDLTDEEVKMVYTKVAKLHAVSYMLAKGKDRQQITKYRKGSFNYTFFKDIDMIKNGMKRFINMLKRHKEFEMYVAKFEALAAEAIPACEQLFTAYENGEDHDICVLNHGDLHFKNFMFKYPSEGGGVPESLLFIDLQISSYNPSIIDLMYSKFMVLSPAQLRQSDAWMRYYWEQFIATLKLIKYQEELPKFAAFQMAALKYRHYSVLLFCAFLPMVILILRSKPEQLKDVDVDKLIENADQVDVAHGHPAFLEEVRYLLPQLLNAGYLD